MRAPCPDRICQVLATFVAALLGLVLASTAAAQDLAPPAETFDFNLPPIEGLPNPAPELPAAPAPVTPAAGAVPATDAAESATSVGTGEPWRFAIDLEGGGRQGSAGVGVQIVMVMTLLTIAPSILLLMTCFTRIVIVLGFVRTAIGVPSAPANQIVTGLSLFLTFFIMGPTLQRSYDDGLKPYFEGKMDTSASFEAASKPLREFMLRQTRTRDLEFFLQLGRFPPTRVDDLPLRVVVPAFVISELQTAFQMGFLIFLPFLVIDLLVSSTLMALGMMMMPPAIIALPFKLLLFVLVDGWHLVVKSLVESFRV